MVDMASTPLKVLYDLHETKRVYARSFQHWKEALAKAKSFPGTVAPESLNTKSILYRTPCFPSAIPSDTSSISGFTRWKSTSSGCRRETKQEPKEELFHLRLTYRIICTVSSSQGFAHWDGTPHNGVALLALGWAYIFSASLVERQGLAMEYGMIQHGKSSSPEQATICLDYATPEERMWWKAITTPGIGWSIAGGEISPWGIEVHDIGLAVSGGSDDDDDGSSSTLPPPPTAEQAARYLARLCTVYRLGHQCSAALAAALTFPSQSIRYFRKAATISLPRPRLPAKVNSDTCDACPADGTLPDEFDHIGHYMTLSLSRRILVPSLWSVFWAPDVPCHMAGAWVQPAASVLKPILVGDTADLELLAKVLSFTRAAPLWLGVALCGWDTRAHSILPYLTTLRTSSSVVNMTAAAWTGLPNSFFDIQPAARSARNGMVPRAEVWRLRHDFYTSYPKDEGFNYLPPEAWAPFGKMREEDVELEIRGHLACQHRWEYQSWTWLLGKYGEVEVASSVVEPLELAPAAQQGPRQQQRRRIPKAELRAIRKMSEMVTKSIFCCASSQVERGFGGTVVRRIPVRGMAEAPRSRSSRMNAERIISILVWLRGVDTDDPVQ